MAYDEITNPITVSELNKSLNTIVSEAFCQIIVVGEISGFKRNTYGHWYFELKDQGASIPCAIWRGLQSRMPVFKDGDLVIAHGQISVYEKTGKITFSISRVELKGDGELKALIEKRKQYYQSLGWFDPQLKKPLPEEIHTLGVVTSATGAAFQDILNVTKRRAPGLNILLFPAVVQGDGADITIASRIRQANNFESCDVLIVGRGGGSAEDLSCFSEDAVIEAIHESRIPVISAVGHEIDFPLSDYVADLRAPTPSAAAELVTETIFKRTTRLNNAITLIEALISRRIEKAKTSLVNKAVLDGYIRNKVIKARSRIKDTNEIAVLLRSKISQSELIVMHSQESMERAIYEKLESRKYSFERNKMDIDSCFENSYKAARLNLDYTSNDLTKSMNEKLSASRNELQSLKKELEALNPLSILSRGYSIVTDSSGKTIKSIKQINKDQKLSIRLDDGSFNVKVEE